MISSQCKQNKKSIIYIGGSKTQIPGIVCAKLANLEVVVTDRAINAPARKFADRFENIAADDIDQLYALALELYKQNKLVGIYGVADYAYQAIGYIYDALKIPYGSCKLYKNMSDKSISRAIWEDFHISTARGYTIHNGIIPDALDLHFPVIVKPADSYNSRAVRTVAEQNNLIAAVENTSIYGSKVIVEELIKGQHVNVDMVIVDGEAFPAGITERFFVDNINHQPLSGIHGYEFEKINSVQLYNLVKQACDSIGFNNGPVTADIILSEGIPYLLEVSPHFHAIEVSSIINLDQILTGWFAYLAGDSDWRNYMHPVAKGFSAYYHIFSDNTGILDEIIGLDKLRQYKGLVDIDVRCSIGSKLNNIFDKKPFCGIVTLKANTYCELHNILFSLDRDIKVVSH